MTTSTYSCDPCNISCPIPTTPGCPRFSTTSPYYSPTSTHSYSTSPTSTYAYSTSPICYSCTDSDYVTPNSALLGTAVTLGIIGGVILPICIAFIFYYRKKAQE